MVLPQPTLKAEQQMVVGKMRKARDDEVAVFLSHHPPQSISNAENTPSERCSVCALSSMDHFPKITESC